MAPLKTVPSSGKQTSSIEESFGAPRQNCILKAPAGATRLERSASGSSHTDPGTRQFTAAMVQLQFMCNHTKIGGKAGG